MTRRYPRGHVPGDDFAIERDEEIRLDTLKLGAYVEQTMHFTTSVSPHRLGLLHDTLRLELTARVLGQHLPPLTRTVTETLAVEVPSTWWQHWKLDHLGTRWAGWVGRRWPVQTRTVTTTATLRGDVQRAALFPEANIMPQQPSLGSPVLLVQQPRWDKQQTPPEARP